MWHPSEIIYVNFVICQIINFLFFDVSELSGAKMQSAPSGAAVSVRDAYKYYGSSKKPKVVLDRLTMTVPKGEMSVQLSLIK